MKKSEMTAQFNFRNELPMYVLDEKYQSDVEGPHADDAGMRYLGQPDTVRTKTGRLITVFPVGHGHGPLIMKYSDDEGENWIKMPDTPKSWNDSQETPTLYALDLGDGQERLVLICACPGGWGNFTTGWDFSMSDDDGASWTEFEHFHSSFSDGRANHVTVGMASLIQLKGDDGKPVSKWMGVYHDDSFVNYKTYLTFDENGRAEWSEPEAYLAGYREIESTHQICEVGMFRSPDGNRIIGLARNQTHAGPATLFYSDDEGMTWSKPVGLPGSLAGERHKALYDPISRRLLISFREIVYDRDGDGVFGGSSDWVAGDWVAWVGTYEDLMNLRQGEYMIRLDEDFSNNTYSGDCGYPGMVVLEDGTFILHSYGHWDEEFSKSYTDGGVYNVKTDLCWIRQVKFRLADVEKEGKLER